MLDSIKEIFAAAPILAWSVVSVLIALVVISQKWEQVKWWWLNTWYSFPVIGKLKRLSKDTNRDTSNQKWFKAEKTLCRDYKEFIKIQDESDYDEKVAYLTKSGDNGRSTTPLLVWPLIVGLVIIEALGFSYVLAGYTIPGASENTQAYGALGIAALISVILVAFTHFTGHELYVSGKIKQARQEWKEAGRLGKTSTKPTPLAQPQSVDDDQPGYVQLMNRVGLHESYVISICTVVVVAIIAIGATYVRGQVLEKEIHDLTTLAQTNPTSTTNSLALKDPLNMTSNGSIQLPDADSKSNNDAMAKAGNDVNSIIRRSGWGTFIILAFIFVFLQILGVLFGFKWGFAGKDGKAAYKAIGAGEYTSYSDVQTRYEKIADAAQSKLENLQQLIMEENAHGGTDGAHPSGSFHQFMIEENNRKNDQRNKNKQNSINA